MDISKKNVKGICDYKCAFSFDYPSNNPVVKNNMIYLSFSSDNTTIPPVIFNSNSYLVSQTRIYSPSLHSFNGEKMPAELIIMHYPQNGGTNLNVCIPINTNDSTNSLLNTIITFSNKNTPSVDDSMILNISNFSLNDIVPKSPFYSYTGKDIDNDYDVYYIVYGKDSSLYITNENSTNLSNIITAVTLDDTTNRSLYFNRKGAVSSEENGEIYISCENTDSSTEMEQITTKSQNNITFNWSEAIKNPIFITIISIIGGIFICLIVYYLMDIAYSNIFKSSKIIQNGGGGNIKYKKVRFNI